MCGIIKPKMPSSLITRVRNKRSWAAVTAPGVQAHNNVICSECDDTIVMLSSIHPEKFERTHVCGAIRIKWAVEPRSAFLELYIPKLSNKPTFVPSANPFYLECLPEAV
jgi:hypothetical protein